jgi:predicted AAA+ superfamily ATPase
MDDLVAWKNSPRRKPLVVTGARQVGKTWLVSEFGRQHFSSVAHVVFLDNQRMRSAFSQSLDPDRLLMSIGIETGTNPLDGNTLVFLDEIQECPRAIVSLKLFCERRPEIPVVAAGSLLGIAMNRGQNDAELPDSRRQTSLSWPVGKVEYLDMHPMTFVEFLNALGNDGLTACVREGDFEMMAVFADRPSELLKTYLYVGGMPEAVQAYVDNPANLEEVRKIQANILRDYEYDFAKHVDRPSDTEHIRQTRHSVPAQLANESDMKRFTYAAISAGRRRRDYKDAVSWLSDAGLVTKVPRITKPLIPLASYEDQTYFKLYMVDVGLLGAATNLDARSLIEGNSLFTHFKGAYAEQYVCQQLVASNRCTPRYWSADGKHEKGEVDFVYECEGKVYPVEVKAEENVRGSSIARFARDNNLPRAVRLSMRGYKDQGRLVNLPLYAANLLPAAL